MHNSWYTVVTFGAPTDYTIAVLGNPYKIGRRVSQNLDDCRRRKEALRQHVSNVRILKCGTRRLARGADISENFEIVE